MEGPDDVSFHSKVLYLGVVRSHPKRKARKIKQTSLARRRLYSASFTFCVNGRAPRQERVTRARLAQWSGLGVLEAWISTLVSRSRRVWLAPVGLPALAADLPTIRELGQLLAVIFSCWCRLPSVRPSTSSTEPRL